MDKNLQSASQAIQAAAGAGHLSPISSQALLANLNGSTLPQNLGTQISKLETRMPVVVNLIVDASGSLDGFEQIVVAAINDTAGDFKKMRNRTGQEIYLSVKVFSSRYDNSPNLRTIQDFIHVQDFVDLTLNDYQTYGETPLRDVTYDGVTQTMAFGASAFVYGATGVQEITVVISDGRDNASIRTDEDLRALLKELNVRPNFVAAFVGVGTYDFTTIALNMGFLPGNIITVDKTATGITKALKLVSSSVGTHSQKSAHGATTPGTFFVN